MLIMDFVLYLFLFCIFLTVMELKPVNETRFTLPTRIEQNHRISIIGLIDNQGTMSISLSGRNTKSEDDCRLIFSPSKETIEVYSPGSPKDVIEYNYAIGNKEYTTFILEFDPMRLESFNKMDIIFNANKAGNPAFNIMCKFSSSESIEYISVKGTVSVKELNYSFDSIYSHETTTKQ